MVREELYKKSLVVLREMAKEMGLRSFTACRKPELIDRMLAFEEGGSVQPPPAKRGRKPKGSGQVAAPAQQTGGLSGPGDSGQKAAPAQQTGDSGQTVETETAQAAEPAAQPEPPAAEAQDGSRPAYHSYTNRRSERNGRNDRGDYQGYVPRQATPYQTPYRE